MAQVNAESTKSIRQAPSGSGRARGILDLSAVATVEPPSLVAEKLLKTKGVTSAEVNVFSKKITVEFDPSLISLEVIRKIIGRQILP